MTKENTFYSSDNLVVSFCGISVHSLLKLTKIQTLEGIFLNSMFLSMRWFYADSKINNY